MKRIIFEVKADRVSAIELEDGATVGALRRILCGSGYDVANANVVLQSSTDGSIHAGRLNGYVLGQDDTVKFLSKENRLVHEPRRGVRVLHITVTSGRA